MSTHKHTQSLLVPKATRMVQSLVAASLLAFAGLANADYLGTASLRVFPTPIDDIADGYDVGDRIQLVMEVTPFDTGDEEGHAAWSTFYVPTGMLIVDAKYVRISGSGEYIESSAEDVDDTYNGYGVRGAKGYGAGLGQGFVNEVQQDTGIFYSTDPRTRQQFGLGTVNATGVAASNVYNEWDRDQVLAYGVGGALSGNGGTGNTPILLGTPNKGTGSPVAGPDAYYTNDYSPALGGTFANRLTNVGPWQRIQTPADKIGGSGPVTPATQQGPILNTAVDAAGGFVFTGSNSLPANTNALRIVHGARRLGDIERWSFTVEVTDVTSFLAQLDAGEICADSIPGDTSVIAAKDNNWRYYEVSRSCLDFSSDAILVKEIINPISASAVRDNDVITYSFSIYNTGLNPLLNVIVRDQQIANLVLVPPGTAGCAAPSYNGTISSGGTVAYSGLAGGIASWAAFDLPVGASATFNVCGRADGLFGELVDNQARADYADCGASPCLTSNAAIPITNKIAGTVYADVDASGDLTLGEEGIPSVVVELYIDVNNNGVYDVGVDTLAASTVTASDGSYEFTAIPNGNYLIVETNLPDYVSTGDIDNSTLNCGAGNGCDTIGGGANGIASSIQVTQATFLVNQDFFDVPPFPDVSIVKSAAPLSVRSGDQLVFTLTVTNSPSSLVPANLVEVTDVLPAGLTWVSTLNSNGGGTCTVGNLAACNCTLPGNTGTLTCQLGTIAIGGTKTITLTTTVD